MNGIRLTVLVENTARGRDLQAEHGLAFWIEVGSRRVLFDTGQSGLIRRNARMLGIDLASADAVVLSHGHYDHTGGLSAVLPGAARTRVFAHPDALGEKYARSPGRGGRSIGVPASSTELLRKAADIIPTEAPVEVCEGLSVTGPIPRITDFEDVGGAFFRDEDCRCPDTLTDDQAAYLNGPDGTVVVLGCAHAGIINTLTYIKQLVPTRPIHTVIGGTHLIAAGEERMRETVSALLELDVRRLLPLHCTGFAAAARIAQEFPGRVSAAPVGTVLEF